VLVILRRIFILFLCALAIPRGLAAAGNESPLPPRNLLLITIDTLRADRVGCYSSRYVDTPQIDSLAAKGVVFLRAFAHTPETLPSHANIMTGATPSYHGVHDNTNFLVRGGLLTLAEYLRESGYATAAFVGAYPLDSRFGLDQGFDTYDDRFDRVGPMPNESWTRRADDVLSSALAWLQGQRAPWFLWIHFWDPHDPYSPPEPYKTQYAEHPYEGEVAYVDAVLGKLWETLGKNGLYGSTVIVLTGDHGESLGEHGERTHGFLAYNSSLWIPLIVASPGVGRRVVQSPVSHVDIFPTVCDLLGVAKPGSLQGRSLVQAMTGDTPKEAPIYFESLSPYYNMEWAPITGFIRKGEKFIDSVSPEIYDLDRDFDEAKNIADSDSAAAARSTLRELISAQTSAQADEADRPPDRETVERMRSLGYLAGARPSRDRTKGRFGPEEDVRALLPFYYRSMDAIDLDRTGRTQEAVEELKAVIAARKNISSAYLNLASLYKKSGRCADAAVVLKAGLEALPSNYYIYLEYVAALYELGDNDGVIRVFEGPQPPQVDFDPLIWNYAGLAWLKKRNAAKAGECFDRSLSIDPDNPVTWYNLGNLRYSEFKETGDTSRLVQAEEGFRKAVALDPSKGSAFFVLGVVLFDKKSDSEAASCLDKALALDPTLSEAHYYLGLIRLRAGDGPGACASFRKFKATPSFGRMSAEEKRRIEDIIAKFSR
jgi:arylsulfatase A-like enzyme/Tfp pilus assembly protein PilF